MAFLENRGISMVKHGGAAKLEIPVKEGKVLVFFTSLSGIQKFLDGKMSCVYFNPAEKDNG